MSRSSSCPHVPSGSVFPVWTCHDVLTSFLLVDTCVARVCSSDSVTMIHLVRLFLCSRTGAHGDAPGTGGHTSSLPPDYSRQRDPRQPPGSRDTRPLALCLGVWASACRGTDGNLTWTEHLKRVWGPPHYFLMDSARTEGCRTQPAQERCVTCHRGDTASWVHIDVLNQLFSTCFVLILLRNLLSCRGRYRRSSDGA